jgi:hypothetical protein
VLDFTGIHRVIRGFVIKVDAVLASPRGDATWAKKLAELVAFGTSGLRFHHQVEDEEFWPALVAKGVEPGVLEPLRPPTEKSIRCSTESKRRRTSCAPRRRTPRSSTRWPGSCPNSESTCART